MVQGHQHTYLTIFKHPYMEIKHSTYTHIELYDPFISISLEYGVTLKAKKR
uniref:Uncharacterized protein n=1 Tax=Rhizophora mucronata TaxID=61149 RepID=A0A2P2QGD6_RHIMU